MRFASLLLLPLLAIAQDAALHRFFEVEWDYDMERSPTRASMQGDRRFNDRWEDLSKAALEARYRHDLEVLRKLDGFDRARFSPEDQLNCDLFRKHYELRIGEYEHHWYVIPLDQRSGIQTAGEMAELLRFDRVKDYEDWIARLHGFGVHMDQTIALMREGIQRKIVQPKIIMDRVEAQVTRQLVAPEESQFFAPFKKLPASIPAADRDRLATEGRKAVAEVVLPAFQRFGEFLKSDYRAAAFDKAGIWQAPDGGDIYAFFVRRYTTTNLTPRQVHEIGIAAVKRIRGEMDAIVRKTGFTGSYAEFLHYLRTDPKFYYKTPQELLDAYKVIAKTIDPKLVKVFRTLPRTPYGVLPIPDSTAPDTTTAYYNQPAADGSRAGTYYVNLYKPEVRPTYEMVALSMHEAVPGHHLQLALQMELTNVPKFRRRNDYTAFVEGWGLYAESLGDEMGLYADPYAKFGQLTYEMWRAVRLVVDTGMHAFHWDRQKAIDFFLENTAKTEQDIVNEIDRYIAWPGQALAYKIGELKFKELRARATAKLGSKFDVREFHDVVLSAGSLPLDVLEQRVDRWIASK